MKIFSAEQLIQLGEGCQEVNLVANMLNQLIGDLWGGEFPRLYSIHVAAPENDINQLRVVVEIAPGILIPCHFENELNEYELRGNAARLVSDVFSDVIAAYPFRDQLHDKLEGLRREVTQRIGFAQSEGLAVRLLELTLTPLNRWSDPEHATFSVAIEVLGANLQPRIIYRDFGDLEEFDLMFDFLVYSQRELRQARTQASEVGADGLIDALALNALCAQGAALDVYRQFVKKDLHRLSHDVNLYWQDGIVKSIGKGGGGLSWFGNTVTIAGLSLTDEAAETVIGQAIGVLVDSPYFDQSIIIKDITRSVQGGMAMVRVSIELPMYCFSAHSGKTWRYSTEHVVRKEFASEHRHAVSHLMADEARARSLDPVA